MEHIRLLQYEYESRPAAREVEESMTRFLAGFCDPFLGPDSAQTLLICRGDEDYHAAASAARMFHRKYPSLRPSAKVKILQELSWQVNSAI